VELLDVYLIMHDKEHFSKSKANKISYGQRTYLCLVIE